MTRFVTILLAVAVIVTAIAGIGSAARPIPPSNETSELYVEISAKAIGNLISSTNLDFAQGNGNLNDNPPLEPGEGVATIVYTEHTMATSGSIEYVHTVSLDTSSRTAPENNLETTRSIDYTKDGDGDGVGRMYSSEAVLISETGAGGSTEGGCCPWPTGDTCVSATCVKVEAGSQVDLKEGSVNSESTARTVSSDVGEDVGMTYSVDVDGSGQTGSDTAEGHAIAYVDITEREGSGCEANQTTDMNYEETVHIDGLIEMAMRTGYTGGQ
jgi:hypothetical protein